MSDDRGERLAACRVLWVTDRFRLRTPLVPRAAALLENGLPGLILRERDLEDGPFEDMACHLRAVAQHTGALLLVTNRLRVAAAHGDGVHLGAGGVSPSEARRAVGESRLIGVSLHRGDGATTAENDEADYVLYSPIFETVSKPGVVPLGLEALAAFCAASPRPVYALGGVTPERAIACLEAGAHGVAVCGALAGDEPAAAAWEPWRRVAAHSA